MKNNHRIKICLNSYSAKTGTLDGKKYLVVPAVLLLEGIHAGSSGPLFYPGEVIARHAAGWSGRPVTISHPMSGNTHVSASSSPEIFERVAIGWTFNARWDGQKLRADLWIDQGKAPASILAALRAGMPMALSTGLFSTDDYTPGNWNGTPYEAGVAEIVPDHVALLLDESPACKGAEITANCVNCKKTNKNTNLEEYNDMEEALETPRFFWDAPIDVQRRLKEHFAANIGHEAAENRTHRMTMQEAIEMDRSLRGCAGSKGNCGGCGTCGDPQVIVNNDGEETPLTIPLMNFEPERPRIDNSDEGEEETPMETPVMTFPKK